MKIDAKVKFNFSYIFIRRIRIKQHHSFGMRYLTKNYNFELYLIYSALISTFEDININIYQLGNSFFSIINPQLKCYSLTLFEDMIKMIDF